MKIKSLIVSGFLLAGVFPLPVYAEPASAPARVEIVPRNAETWFGTGSASSGKKIAYISATLTYVNGSWGARAWVTSTQFCNAQVTSVTPCPDISAVCGYVSIDGVGIFFKIPVYSVS